MPSETSKAENVFKLVTLAGLCRRILLAPVNRNIFPTEDRGDLRFDETEERSDAVGEGTIGLEEGGSSGILRVDASSVDGAGEAERRDDRLVVMLIPSNIVASLLRREVSSVSSTGCCWCRC